MCNFLYLSQVENIIYLLIKYILIIIILPFLKAFKSNSQDIKDYFLIGLFFIKILFEKVTKVKNSKWPNLALLGKCFLFQNHTTNDISFFFSYKALVMLLL